MLQINNLHVNVGEKAILRGIDLTINPGEVHVIMGPNGSGKSTLANVLAGRPEYQITQGDALLEKESLAELSADERARAGLFLAFQYPIEIPGVNNIYFLKAAVNAKRKQQGLDEIDAFDFLQLVKEKMKALHMSEALLYRDINAGFSGGEKKRNEILQMSLLEPKLAILDETDSGLDIDALKCVAEGINRHRREDRAILLVTHYQRLLDYVQPDFVHVLSKGKIVKSGDKTLAHSLEQTGYAWLKQEAVEE